MNWSLHENKSPHGVTPRSQTLESPDQRHQNSAAKCQKQRVSVEHVSYFFEKCEVRCLGKLEKRRDEDERQDWKRFTKRRSGYGDVNASGLDARDFAGCGEVCMGESGDGCGLNKADGGALWLRGMTQAEWFRACDGR